MLYTKITMNYIFLILLSTFLTTFSLQPTEKICINCKFFSNSLFTDNKFGKCLLFPYKHHDTDYLVTGINKNEKPQYHYCSTARKFHNMCGEEGKKYEKNDKK
jgi:hypothetical protein